MSNDDKMDNFTPAPLVRQMYGWLSGLPGFGAPRRILDPGAGRGVFGAEARKMWPKAELVAVEIRPKFEKALKKIYDDVVIGDFADVYATIGRFDLVVTNPHFPVWQDYVEYGLEIVHAGGDVVLLGIMDWGTRSKAASDLFQRHPPRNCARVNGPVSFRHGKATDRVSYAWWRWSQGEISSPKTWMTCNLDRLSSAERSHKEE